MQTYTPPGSPARPLAAGIAHWTTANTIPAGPQNAPPSPPRTRPVKKSRFTKVRNFLRRDSTPSAPMPTSAIRHQITEHPNITPRRPTPLRPTVRRPQTAAHTDSHTTSTTSNQPFKIPRKPLPPGALSRSQWMALANSASTQAPSQPHMAPMSSAPVSPISTSAMGAQYDSRPVSPMFPTSPASSTASEPDFNQARINRMSTYSYLEGQNIDLSSYAFSPCADKFAISRSASPVALTRASSSAVNISARGPYVLRTATPVAFQKARAVNVPGPVRNPSAASSPRSRLRLALTSEITPRSTPAHDRPALQSPVCLRLKFLIQFAHTDNVTWDYLPVGYWSAVETHVGVIVACAPAIRSLTGNLRNRFFPKPTSQPSYYDDSTAHSSSKRSKGTNNSRNWGSKNGAGSRLSSLSTARGDKEFVQIDEYEMDVGGGGRLKADQRSTAEGSEEGSVNRSHTPYDDIEAAPLATTAAPIGRGVNGIMVQTDFTVGRS
ncbi:hypothetical protein D6D25_07761 [Aureobasidium pullulans]|nr:hypothetical protein D6D25_07761 [Aureobasidium pullulans]